MGSIGSKVYEIYYLEKLAKQKTAVHTVHPFVKLISCMVFIVCIVSFDRYAITPMVPFVFFPVVLMALGNIPYKKILDRTMVALPFSIFAGLSNVFFDRRVFTVIGSLPLSYGAVSLISILFRTVLCVCAVLILIATTPFYDMASEMSRMRIPGIFITLFEMTYRYISVLLGEVSSMYTAYTLRSGNHKGIEMRHMGSFIGQLLLRSFDRADRIYNAMKCRGYSHDRLTKHSRPITFSDLCLLAAMCAPMIFLRLVNVQNMLNQFIGRMI